MFILGCPACLSNFRNLFCTIFCSPDQASFTNVTAVQQAKAKPSGAVPGGGEVVEEDKTVTAVKEVAFYLSEDFKNDTFQSCNNVVFGAANTRSMLFIGNGATTAQVRRQCLSTCTCVQKGARLTQVLVQAFLDFIGTVKDKTATHIGSPFQLDFPETTSHDEVPREITPWSAHVPPCWDNALRCSCGDCPAAPTCALPSDHPVTPGAQTCQLQLTSTVAVLCGDVAIWLPGVLLLGLLVWMYLQGFFGPTAYHSRACLLYTSPSPRD